MGLLQALLENKDTLLRGASLLIGGAALVLVGSLIGAGAGKLAMLSAGTIAITGVVVMFLGFFVYILPPLLPSR
jgi:hypothetical protein